MTRTTWTAHLGTGPYLPVTLTIDTDDPAAIADVEHAAARNQVRLERAQEPLGDAGAGTEAEGAPGGGDASERREAPLCEVCGCAEEGEHLVEQYVQGYLLHVLICEGHARMIRRGARAEIRQQVVMLPAERA